MEARLEHPSRPPPEDDPPRTDLLDCLQRHHRQHRASIAGPMEDCFLNNFDSIDYDLNPALVRSTIAIALSPDGSSVATTHGDHTVKIFRYADASLFRVFEGHPRTPWTVKYHHTNSDVVASGCLGFEIFVWSISENCKLNSIRYSNSIISLSFQPHGPYIAVASGIELRLWNWAEDARLSIDGPSGSIIESSKPGASRVSATYRKQYPRMKTVSHTRNIRAVLFHPFGKVLLAAAPDDTRTGEIPVVYSRLYAFNIDSIAMPSGDDGDSSPSGGPVSVAQVNLTSLPFILPQIHLYSDGGLDISPDGRFLFVCSTLYHRNYTKASTFSSSNTEPEQLEGITRGLSGLSLSGGSDGYTTTRNPINLDTLSDDTSGYSALSCLCLYRFIYPVDDTIDLAALTPCRSAGFHNAALHDVTEPKLELMHYRCLTESLLKAITSVKISPTCRYGLLGYGVRDNGRVKSHKYGFVASEIVSLQDGDLRMAAVMTDELDEVNIAQFHPLPGGGIIYGTKRGRVRVFKRASLLKD